MKNAVSRFGSLFLFVGMYAFAGDKTLPNLIEPVGVGPRVTLVSGSVVVAELNSFGRTGHGIFSGGGFAVSEKESVLFEHLDLIGVGTGPLMPIADRSLGGGCDIVNPISADTASHATSTVQCGPCTLDFDQTVDEVTGSWNTFVTISNCDAACYYSYTDYDVHDFSNNDAIFQPGGGGFLGQFVVRNATLSPDVHYLFTDLTFADHFEMRAYPGLRALLLSAQQCTDLADAPLTFNGDFTGALQFNAPAFVNYSHGRDDTTIFP